MASSELSSKHPQIPRGSSDLTKQLILEAAELARHGARCRIVDRMPEPSKWCRAIGVTPRTLEIWDDMGIARQMIDSGMSHIGFRCIRRVH